MKPRAVALGLGSNLGGRLSLLRAGAELVAERLGAQGFRSSPVWATAPLGPPQPPYLNAAIAIVSASSLDEILEVALSVEAALGRERRERWGARSLDIDVLWHDGPPFSSERVEVPHPALTQRAFAMAPLVALFPDAKASDGTPLGALLAARADFGERVAETLSGGFDSRVLSHTADEGFEVRAPDRADLVAAATEALGGVIVNPSSVAPRELRTLTLDLGDEDDDARLIAALSEVLYALDAGRFALRRAAVLEDGDALRMVLVGEAIDAARHEVRTAVKAVTWHGLEVGRDGEGHFARVIVDL